MPPYPQRDFKPIQQLKAKGMKARPIYEIARDIRAEWKNPYFGAVPYLDAMRSLTDKDSRYIMEDASTIVMYFLANAGTFRGSRAKELKTELRNAVK